MEYVPCIGNSSYSFWWILLKLYRCFKDGLEICILFFQNPEIIFYHFFRIFNLDIFRALILQICIWSIYLVSATPPTVFGESFWNFTVVFRMVWRYAYCFLRILKLFFLHFNLDIFSSLYATDMYREYMPCIGNPAYSFRPILLKLYRYFAAFLWFHMRNLSLAGYNCSGGASCMACSFITSLVWRGRGLNPRPPALEADALPLGYRGGLILVWILSPIRILVLHCWLEWHRDVALTNYQNQSQLHYCS